MTPPSATFPRDARHARLLSLADLSDGTGLEVGPLDKPVAVRGHHDVRYVDVFPAERLRQHYATDPSVDVEAIAELDFVLSTRDGVMPLAEAVAGGAPYRWVIASHVIEHVPDLIGWLAQLAAVMDAGGRLLLAVPDRRYTFDALRPQTSVGQLLEAHLRGDSVPSVRAVYDHFRSAVTVDAAALWAGASPDDAPRMVAPSDVMDLVARARSRGEYLDAHVWTFTPDSFAEQCEELGRLGLIQFGLQRLVPTAQDDHEFYAVLERWPCGQPSPASAAVAPAAPAPPEELTPRDYRHERLLGLADFSRGTGLEIGPLGQPVAIRPFHDVRYVDVFAADELRRHYAGDASVDLAAIPDIDFVLSDGEGVRALVDAAAADAPYDWAVASHVAEHVPDLIGWLAEVAELLVDGAPLVLALPDRRYCFDSHRVATTVGQLLDAHYRGERVPSVRAVYDFLSRAVTIDPAAAWRGELPPPDQRIHDVEHALAAARASWTDGSYHDAHVWLFTPESFRDQLCELGRLGLSEFAIETITATRENELEFYAVLRRLDRSFDATARGPLFEAPPAIDVPARPAPAAPVGTHAEATVSPPPRPSAGAVVVRLSRREIRLIRLKRRLMEALRRRR